jgi:hypothetical protein
MQYDVRIRELRQVIVTVEADSMAQAKALAQRNWNNDEYSTDLDTTRFHRATFETLYPNYSLSERYWDADAR